MGEHPREGQAWACVFGCRGHNTVSHRVDTLPQVFPYQTQAPLRAPLVTKLLFQGPSMSRFLSPYPVVSSRLLCPQVLTPLRISSSVVSVCGERDTAIEGLDHGILLQQLPPWPSVHFWATPTNPIINQFLSMPSTNCFQAVFFHSIFIALSQAWMKI